MKNVLIGIVGILVFVAIYLVFYHWWWLLITAGALMFGGSFLLKAAPKYAADGEHIDPDFDLEGKDMSDEKALGKRHSESMMISEDWDEAEIGSILRSRKQGFNMLFYAEQIMSRFVDGQEARTAEKRVEFLKQQNEAVRAYIENKRLMGQVKRVGWEERTAVEKARAANDRVKDEAELEKLRIEAEKEEVLLRRDQARKQREDLNRPAAAQVKEPSVEEINQIQLKNAERKIELLKKEIRIADADPSLQEGVKRAKLNALYDELAQAEAERIRLL